MKLTGHRGCKNERPENTILGFEAAIKAGVKAIEFDVHSTRDGELIVIHDPTLERTTNGSGEVKNKTLEELSKLDAGEGEKIPTLKESLELFKKYNIESFIEIKSSNCEEQTVKLIKELELIDLTTVICFNHRVLQKVKSVDSNIRTGCLLYGLPIKPIQIIESVNAGGISLSTHTIDKQLVDEVHKAGYFVKTWNANSKEEIAYFEQMGVDYVCTDIPIQILS